MSAHSGIRERSAAALPATLESLRTVFFPHTSPGDHGAADTVVREHVDLATRRLPGADIVHCHPAGPLPAVLVVTDDMPLLVDTLSGVVESGGAVITRLLHPVVPAIRDETGTLIDVGADRIESTSESWMRFELAAPMEDSRAGQLRADLAQALTALRNIAADLPATRERVEQVAATLAAATSVPAPWDREELADSVDLLRWFGDGNVTFLGYHYQGRGTDITDELGVFRTTGFTVDPDRATQSLVAVAQGPEFPPSSGGLHPHLITVPDIGETGAALGEHRFLGVFTVTALHENVLDIPVLAHRVRDVITKAGYRLDSHTGQTLLDIIQDHPRPELFALDVDTLHRTVVSVLGATEREDLLLFLRPAGDHRSLSALVYLPRDRYTTAVRTGMQRTLLEQFPGTAIDHTVRVTENPLALVHFSLRAGDDQVLDDHADWSVVEEQVRARLATVCRSWDDALHDHLRDVTAVPASVGAGYMHRLPASYKHDFTADRAAADIVRLQALAAGAVDVALHTRPVGEHTELRFTLYVAGERVSLSEILPILHSLGVEVLDERPYPVTRPDGLSTWIYEFTLRPAGPADVTATVAAELHSAQPGTLARRFCDTFVAAWSGAAEVDSFNALVARVGLTWTEAALLRAYAKYLRQIGFPYSATSIAAVLADNPRTCAALIDLFTALFDPTGDPSRDSTAIAEQIGGAIEEVVSLEADRILRAYLDLMRATVRTNYYRTGDGVRRSPALSLKLEPSALSQLPQPRPRFEVFVYSPHVEGVHLRYGAVARGGLRWSDRREDFRTEILGLVKAQAVKNAVIVPVGAKGGFVVTRPPAPTGDPVADRDASRAAGVECYRAFIGALLDVTDNVHPETGATVPPAAVVRRDGDDPYLVVAADKGTATFSDEANAVAAEYGFWLGDAFASGGSVGYDHKAMGITAKGAWESVKRHFREMGIDTQNQDFTVAGVGDMSGDVFGNGMLLSEHIRLVAAFDHRHIFVDPNPDPVTSYRERARLFELPRSSWTDYDTARISAGGGVFDRTAKSVPVSAEMREALGLDSTVTRLSPQDLIRAILRAPVDLMWNGGIGTYVKAARETHLEVGDKANDGVRVDAGQVRATVIGEGGNLGVTALGRIEFALDGGRINTDALDNSAGVDCSDHEVNIKILLDGLVATGRIDPNTRNRLLQEMTDDVERLVLADNVDQNALLGTGRVTAAGKLRVHARQIRALEAQRGLDRTLEALPGEDELERRGKQGHGLTSPELATLTAHVKLALKADLLAGDLVDGDAFTDRLLGYFPARLREDYPDAIRTHRLRREIIATVITNEVVDTGGITYVFRLCEDTGASTVDAVRAFAAASAIADLPALIRGIRTGAPNTAVSDAMMSEVRRLLDRLSRWLLNHRPQPLAIGAEITRYGRAFECLLPKVSGWLQGPDAVVVRTRTEQLVARGADEHHATAVLSLLHGFCAMDIIDIADLENRELDEVAELYYTLNAHLGLDHLLTAISGLDDTDRWNGLARLALRDDVYGSMRLLCLDVLSGSASAETAAEKIADWEATNTSRLARARSILTEIFAAHPADLATLSVAARQVRTMVGRAGTGQPNN
ncbi:NAD-glutamate dehydrogenase [Rhodococcus sp. NPDC056960]|uniref:NAD-glutamate dehydrogenase n=1 Tax=Rhodococcus sp. NPDC056960 TaxID=3345982 RepID=UPI003635B788